MIRSLHTAGSGMIAQQTQIDVIAHNMANVSTTGFRRSRAQFQDLLYQQMRAPGARTAGGGVQPTGLSVGGGTRTASTQLMHMQGSLQQTGNPLDLAIEGNGFFQVRRPDGQTLYTRGGSLHLDPDGRLVTSEGLPIEPATMIPQGATSVTITSDGTVSVTMPGSSETQEMGRLQLASFMNPGGLDPVGHGLYRATSGSGAALVAAPGEEGLGTVGQGMLEGSNVEVVTEMIDLISTQRAYEINQRVISAADEMLRRTTEI